MKILNSIFVLKNLFWIGCIILFIVDIFFLLVFKKGKKTGKEIEKKEEKKEEKKLGYASHSWRSLLFLAPTVVILYLVASWSQFKGTFVQFMLTQKVLGWVFGIAIVTYIITYSVLSTLDWKWYAKLGRRISGWAIVVLLGYMVCSYAGCSMNWVHKLGLFNPTLASLPPVEVCRDGTITIIYKPEYIRQEINLDLLPGKKYKVYTSSYMKWENWNKGKRKVHDVQPNGLDWTIRTMEDEFGEKAHVELFPIKDKSTKFAGVVANIDGRNQWLRVGGGGGGEDKISSYVQGKKLLSVTLNDWQEESSFLKYEGIMRVTLIPQ